jgi:ubiquinone/menaquinone biosynthesis C-methylase UbiE
MNKDFFSHQSEYYAKYRPTYPIELYEYVASLVNEKKLVWDVATGNGQAAFRLSDYFEHVYATDLSEQQLKNAKLNHTIEYKLEHAEECSLEDNSVDLITVATAIHWFDLEAFYKQVRRVLKPGGVLFAWSYGGCTINTAIDKVIDYFNFEYLYDYWHEGAKMNWNDKYKSLPMPYETIDTPAFVAKADYTLEEVMNYMYSWSGVQAYIKQEGKNPLLAIEKDLQYAWGNMHERKEVKWHLHSKCCRKV